ncbi:hypothetical protein Celaphus_00012293, partial [Cervus elaphus hippelaphus]
MLSRAKPAVGGDPPHTDKRKKKGRKIPKLEELLSQRDFTGAITLLELQKADFKTASSSTWLTREYLALNVYVALCYYKLDYYDVSQEVLAVYLQQIPDSTIALNLKACNHFRLYNGKAAE